MTLIATAVYSTDANNRAQYTIRTLNNMLEYTDFNKHRLGISDNGSCDEVQKFYIEFRTRFIKRFPQENLIIKLNGENLGTAKAINRIIALRKDGESVCKRDDDTEIFCDTWLDDMDDCIRLQPKIGLIGGKRNDLLQSPTAPAPYTSELVMLPHKHGEGQWRVVETAEDIIGTCTLFSDALLKHLGGMRQISTYGADDYLMCQRAHLAGFATCFYPHFAVHHIDTGVLQGGYKTDFIIWKEQHSGTILQATMDLVKAMKEGREPIYFDPTN